jgi:alginate O-acetyltransferase complex protein AlgI
VTWYLTPELWLAILGGVIGSLPVGPALAAWRARWAARATSTGRAAVAFAGVAALVFVLIASIVQIAARTYNPFIYFRF